MNVSKLLREEAKPASHKALPILSFPAAQKLGVTVEELVKNSQLQAKTMTLIASETDTLAAVSLMDLSVEAEAFGANVCYFTDEVPAVVGQLISDMDEAEFEEYVASCKSRSIYDTGVTAEYGDMLITLSTCEYTYTNGRFVVVAKKIVE